jgi:hypothetical protein
VFARLPLGRAPALDETHSEQVRTRLLPLVLRDPLLTSEFTLQIREMEEDRGGMVPTRLGDVRKPRRVRPNEDGESE